MSIKRWLILFGVLYLVILLSGLILSKVGTGRTATLPSQEVFSPSTSMQSVPTIARDRQVPEVKDDTIRISPAGPDIYVQGTEYIHERESDYGRSPECKRGWVGPHGERGEYQITPIFEEDIWRLFKERIDPYDNAQCKRLIPRWLKHYRPGAKDLYDVMIAVQELWACYNRGPTGSLE